MWISRADLQISISVWINLQTGRIYIMKLGILTFPNSKSYGAVLQMFALYKACVEMGYDTQIINYHNLWMKKEKHLVSQPGQKKAVFWAKKKLNEMMHLPMKIGFSRFENQMVKFPTRAFSNKEQLRQIASNYGAVVCGSDQVWNPDITNFDLSYFLDFCGPETARISYAPSFGVECLSEAFGEQVRAELEKFQDISVREASGRQIVRDLMGRDATLVIDPTFLLDAQQWRAYEEVQPQVKGDYILYYTIRSSDTLWKHCLELAKKTNMKILRVGGNVVTKYLKQTDGVEYICDASPAQWLYLVRNARYVLTNSFHGTAFSVNYQKDFYVEFSSPTNTRLSNIVNLLGLQERVLREDLDIVPSSVDYSKTEEVLPLMKKTSGAFLAQALTAAAERYER